MKTEIKNHVKDFNGFLNEQKLNEEATFDNNNYFCQMVKKYSKKKKMEWIIRNEAGIDSFDEMERELATNPNVTKTISGSIGRYAIYRNKEQPELEMSVDYRYGNYGGPAVWVDIPE